MLDRRPSDYSYHIRDKKFVANAWGSVCLTGCCNCSNAKQELIYETINLSRRSHINLEEALQNAASEALLRRKQDTWQDVRLTTHVYMYVHVLMAQLHV